VKPERALRSFPDAETLVGVLSFASRTIILPDMKRSGEKPKIITELIDRLDQVREKSDMHFNIMKEGKPTGVPTDGAEGRKHQQR
jgi:hypothetical protein